MTRHYLVTDKEAGFHCEPMSEDDILRYVKTHIEADDAIELMRDWGASLIKTPVGWASSKDEVKQAFIFECIGKEIKKGNAVGGLFWNHVKEQLASPKIVQNLKSLCDSMFEKAIDGAQHSDIETRTEIARATVEQFLEQCKKENLIFEYWVECEPVHAHSWHSQNGVIGRVTFRPSKAGFKFQFRLVSDENLLTREEQEIQRLDS